MNLTEQAFGKFFAAQLTQLNAQIFAQLDGSASPDVGLKQNPSSSSALVDLALLKQRVSSAQSTNPAVASTTTPRLIEVSVKFLKRPTGYEGPMQLSNKIDLNSSQSTVASLKEWVYKQTRLPVKFQRLVHKGKALNDSSPVADYYDSAGISADSSAWIIHCMASGAVELDSSQQEPGLPDEFWTGMEQYLTTRPYLSQEKSAELLKSFKRICCRTENPK